MAVAKVPNHQQVTLQWPGTQHPLFRTPDPLSPRLSWISLIQGKTEPFLACGLGVEGRQGIEVIGA